MPSSQRGQVRKLANGSWAYRLRDDAGRRPQVGGFPTKGAASVALSDAIDAVRDGKLGIRRQLTISDLIDEFLDQHIAEENTIATLRARLKHVTKAFGSRPLDRLMVNEIAAWRKRLPEGSAWHIAKAFRQVLHYAVRAGLIDENPATKVPNPEPKRREVPAFESLAEVVAVAAELSPALHPLPSSLR